MKQSGEQLQPAAQDDRQLIVAVFYENDRVAAAVVRLEEVGFAREDIGVGSKDLTRTASEAEPRSSAMVSGATTGVVSGGMVGGVFGLLMGISSVVPELSSLLLADLVGVTLTGIGVGAASGGVLGSLIAYRVRGSANDKIASDLFEGGVWVAVEAGERQDEVKSVLIEAGGDLGPTNAAEVLTSEAERKAYFS